MVRMLLSLCCAAALASLSVQVQAHTDMVLPKPKFPDGFYNGNSPYGRINGDKIAGADGYGAAKLAKAMSATGAKTLRAFIMKNIDTTAPSKECGLTITTGEKQPLPDVVDFPWGHPGPCEVWCDNNRIFFNEDCQTNKIGKIPVDKTKCAGVNLIQAMYVGVHVPNWEVYSNCAPIVGGTKTDTATVFSSTAAAGGESASDATTPTTTPAASASSTPATTTAAPASTPAPTALAPASSSPSSTPAPTTAAPTSKPKCTKRLRF